MKKTILTILLCGTLILGLTGCGEAENKDKKVTDTLVCTINNDKTTEKVTMKFNNNNLIISENEIIFDSEDVDTAKAFKEFTDEEFSNLSDSKKGFTYSAKIDNTKVIINLTVEPNISSDVKQALFGDDSDDLLFEYDALKQKYEADNYNCKTISISR